jgi:spore coat protein U-like protein
MLAIFSFGDDPVSFATTSLIRRAGTCALAAALFATSGTTAFAATATSNFSVTATILSNCLITATNLVFGNYDPTLATNTTAGSTLSVVCTKGNATAVVGIGPGLHAVGTQRNMNDTGADPLAYILYQPPSNTPGAACVYTGTPTQWGDGTAATAGTTLALGAAPSVSARVYNVCGSIAAGQSEPAGAYTDATVVATVTF